MYGGGEGGKKGGKEGEGEGRWAWVGRGWGVDSHVATLYRYRMCSLGCSLDGEGR
jgi:hypothetical protein